MDAVYEVRHLTKTYREGRVVANRDLSFDIHRGEVFGLLGPNGAGKSTLVGQLVGLIRPSAGTIRLFGVDVTRSAEQVPRYVSYLAQRPGALASVPAEEAVALTGYLRGLTRHEAARQARRWIEAFGLQAAARQRVRHLSGGQQRLVALAAALVGDLPVLVLDEPTNELDPERRRQVWDVLLELNRRRGTTVVLVTHNVLEAERVLQRVGIIHHGRLVALDRVAALKARVDRRLRVEFRLREGEPDALPPPPPGTDRVTLGPGHLALLVPRERLQEALAHLVAEVGLHRLEDFRVQEPTLEDVYLQLREEARHG